MTQKDLVINNFQKGIGESPYVGFGNMQNLELFQVPGTAKIKYGTTLSFSTTGLPVAIVKDASGNTYVGTESGYIYKNGSVIASAEGIIYDMKVWQNYLFITRASVMDVYGPLNSGGAQLFQNWQTGMANFGKPILPLTGNTMYVGNGGNVATITNFVAGAVGVAPTATWNATAVPLQTGEAVQTLAELGRTLLIGTQGGSNFYDFPNSGIGNVYPYDLGTLTLGFPIAFEENGVNQMFTVNNQTYVQAGIYGNIYITNGTSVQFHKKIPFNRAFGTTIFPYPNAINYINNELLIGTSTGGDGFPNSTSIHGVYSLRGGVLSFRTISTLNVGTNQVLKIGAILPTGQDTMLIGWQDGSTYGVDTIDFRAYQSFSAFFESQVLKVGTPLNNKTFQDIEVQLTRPLITGQQIRLKWREGITSSWNTIATLDMTNAPAGSTALYTKALINNANTIQIRCELSQPTNTQSPNNIEIMEIRIR